ncbi:MAG TPA: L-fucose/L-arabinose isomerase family protein [Aggregatilineaceae bacterium]|nr:L-fucose/L-arabinose isomerase family protein [Aggregatilineaceae bacterium]
MQTSSPLSLGFVPIARPTFDVELAAQVTREARTALENAGFKVIAPENLVSTLEQAQFAARLYADNPPDLLLVFQATFADSTMMLHLAQSVDAPLLLWAIPEERTGERLRLNSLCGINLGAHGLKRAELDYEYVYAQPNAEQAIEKVRAVAQAGRVRRLLRGTRIGRVGEHPAGFDTCRVDQKALQATFGINIIQFDLQTFFEKVRAADTRVIESVRHRLGSKMTGLEEVDQTALNGTLSTYIALRDIAERERIFAFAVRCWPEFFTDLGCAACGALSLMNNEFKPCSCEADVNGSITQLILQWLSGQPAFDSDLVVFDPEDNAVTFWHCGKAPLDMADNTVAPKATVHSNRQLPLLMEFPLKPGRVTVARLSEATGSYRLVVGTAEMIRAPMSFTGTSGLLRFDRPANEVLDTLLSEGLEHHMALTYGDYVPALLALAKMLHLPVLRL